VRWEYKPAFDCHMQKLLNSDNEWGHQVTAKNIKDGFLEGQSVDLVIMLA